MSFLGKAALRSSLAIPFIYITPDSRSMVDISHSSCLAGLVRSTQHQPASCTCPAHTIYLISSKRVSTAMDYLDRFVSSYVRRRRPRVPSMSLVISSADQFPLFDQPPYSPFSSILSLPLKPTTRSRPSGCRHHLRSVFSCSFGPR